MKIDKQVLHVAEAASVLCCSSQVIYDLIHKGSLPAYKTGKAWKIPEGSIHDYIKSKLGNKHHSA